MIKKSLFDKKQTIVVPKIPHLRFYFAAG